MADKKLMRYKIHRGLAWSLTAYHLSLGLSAFLKLPPVWKPGFIMIGASGSEKPGVGDTGIESYISAYTGIANFAPFIAVIYGQISGSREAKRAASIFPILYHLALGLRLLLFNSDGHGLNPEIAPLSVAAGGHISFGIICCGLYYFAENSPSFKA